MQRLDQTMDTAQEAHAIGDLIVEMTNPTHHSRSAIDRATDTVEDEAISRINEDIDRHRLYRVRRAAQIMPERMLMIPAASMVMAVRSVGWMGALRRCRRIGPARIATALVICAFAVPVDPAGATEPDSAAQSRDAPSGTESSFVEKYGNLPARIRLELAARQGNPEAAERALADGATVDAAKMGFPVMRRAIQGASPGVVELFLSRGADPNRTFELDGKSIGPLYFAIRKYGHCGVRESEGCADLGRIVRILLDFGARFPTGVSREGWKHPITYAVWACDLSLVRRLLNSGIDLRRPDTGRLPLLGGCGSPELTRMLLDHGAQVTPGFVEAFLDDVDATWKAEVAHWLLDEGVDPASHRFVWAAMRWKNDELLERALDMGASPDRYYPDDRSTNNVPLITAAIHGRKEAAGILLKYDADASRTWRGKTPVEWAQVEGHHDIKRLLEAQVTENQ